MFTVGWLVVLNGKSVTKLEAWIGWDRLWGTCSYHSIYVRNTEYLKNTNVNGGMDWLEIAYRKVKKGPVSELKRFCCE